MAALSGERETRGDVVAPTCRTSMSFGDACATLMQISAKNTSAGTFKKRDESTSCAVAPVKAKRWSYSDVDS